MFLPEPPHSAAVAAAYENDLAEDGFVFNNTRLWSYRPDVTDAFEVQPAEPDLDGIVRFLCEEREFSRERVSAALERTFRERSLW